MQKILLSGILATTFAVTANAQTVNIPDANFKAYLVGNTEINTNGDTEIQVSEAQSFTGFINCSNDNIADLTGIEQFTALTQLNCGGNLLTTLDLSLNSALVLLGVHNNQLTELNIKNGNNTNFTAFMAYGNPNLNCIEVDNAGYSTDNWTSDNFQFDESVSFDENCNYTTSIADFYTNNISVVYPNPTSNTLNVEVKETTNIKIVNVLGATITSQRLNAGNNSINVSNLTNGVYFINSDKGGVTKFIKK